MDNKEINLRVNYRNGDGLAWFATQIIDQQESINQQLKCIHNEVHTITSEYWKGNRANEFIKDWNDAKDGIIQVCTNFMHNWAVTLYGIAKNYSEADMTSLGNLKIMKTSLSLNNIELTNGTNVEFKNFEAAQKSMENIGEFFNSIIGVIDEWRNRIDESEWISATKGKFLDKVDELKTIIRDNYLMPTFDKMTSEFSEADKEFSNIK